MNREQSSGTRSTPLNRNETSPTEAEIADLQAVKQQLQQDVEHLQNQYRTLQQAVSDQKPRSSLSRLPKPQLGLWLILISTLALSVHNVIVRILLGQPIALLGLFSFGGFVQPTIGNSLLILWMRMLIVVPLMMGIAGFIYPPVWQDIKRLILDRDRRSLITVMFSGAFLFLSQVLIYIAIAQISPGVAVTILFMYPLLTVPLAWWLFGDRPTQLRLVVMLLILVGVVLTAAPRLSGATLNGGVLTAVFSGLAFALYLILMQIGFKKLHPVPVSLVQFMTILVLSSVSLSLPLPLEVSVLPDGRAGFLIGGLVLGVLTLFGYLANNFGVRYMGAAQASIVAASGPVLTAVLAAFLIQTKLEPVQVIGILLVTIGVTAMSFERMKKMKKPANATRQ